MHIILMKRELVDVNYLNGLFDKGYFFDDSYSTIGFTDKPYLYCDSNGFCKYVTKREYNNIKKVYL